MKWNKKFKNFFLIAVFIINAAIPLFAGISFHSPAINDKDQVLYTVCHNIQGTKPYNTLFYTKINEGKSKSEHLPLTCYPEQFNYLPSSNSLRIHNRYGTAFYSFDTNSFRWSKLLSVIPKNHGRCTPVSISPDGQYYCYIQRFDTASGKLMLVNIKTKEEYVLVVNSPFSYYSVPVKWSPDSKTLLYENNDSVFFCTPEEIFNGIDISERFRKIGRGHITSLCWASDKNFIYIKNDIIYEINSSELYTLGLYSGFIIAGASKGRLPFCFNPLTDKFYVNKDASQIVIIQSKSMISYFKTVNSYSYIKPVYTQPYISETGSVTSFDVIWTKKNPLLWVNSISLKTGQKNASVYLLDENLSCILTAGDAQQACVSPAGDKVAFSTGSSVYVYFTAPWKRISAVSGENVVSLAWKDNNNLCIGGTKTVQLWNISLNSRTLLFLATADRGFWLQDGKTLGAVILMQSEKRDENIKNNVYIYNPATGGWISRSDIAPKASINQNGKYRLFMTSSSNSDYDNALYIRTLSGETATRPLYSDSVIKKEPQRKVTLAINALNSDAGLVQILSVLQDFNLKATFFINGEFIQRYPKEVKQIAILGHECASLFYTPEKLNGKGFKISEQFIHRGLGRTEDEFYEATGSELAPLWHAPYYYASSRIVEYGKNAGYTYIAASDSIYDFITMNDSVNGNGQYYTAGELINRYMKDLVSSDSNLKSVFVLPVTVGIENGHREDYLYDRLDVLIESILNAGYTILPYQAAFR